MNYQEFVDGEKTLVVSPAGYGKTYSIAECVKYTTGRQLILTHTHAGITSIKTKLSNAGIPGTKFRVETISSFAQKYMMAFYKGNDIPDLEDSNYHEFLLSKSVPIIKSGVVRKVIKATYSGLFIDEYQDCTKSQHSMILALSSILPTHIFGDPLQGIFDFNETVDFDLDLIGFQRFPDMTVPHRWYQSGNNRGLGEIIMEVRNTFEKRENLHLVHQPDVSFNVHLIIGELYANQEYKRELTRLLEHLEDASVLVIIPEYIDTSRGQRRIRGTIAERARLRSYIDFRKKFRLLEAIDDKLFYSLARKSDEIIASIKSSRNYVKKIRKEILQNLYNSTDLDEWFNDDGFKRKRKTVDQEKSKLLSQAFDEFFQYPSPGNLLKIIQILNKRFMVKFQREEIMFSYLKALKIASLENLEVIEAMRRNRNVIRRLGRKVLARCIGTTLLTKGLEFDVVVILDAHKFDSHKKLYVAISRACKSLHIFTNSLVLSPYRN